jgi:hypothetical protein
MAEDQQTPVDERPFVVPCARLGRDAPLRWLRRLAGPAAGFAAGTLIFGGVICWSASGCRRWRGSSGAALLAVLSRFRVRSTIDRHVGFVLGQP